MSSSEQTTLTFDVPPESDLLRQVYKKSGLTIAELSAATGLSMSTIPIVFGGFRYRDGQPRLAVPPDASLVKLGAALRVDPQAYRVLGRERAAELLAEAYAAEEGKPTFTSDAEAQAHVAGRRSMAREILAAFSTDDLRAELARRDETENKEHG